MSRSALCMEVGNRQISAFCGHTASMPAGNSPTPIKQGVLPFSGKLWLAHWSHSWSINQEFLYECVYYILPRRSIIYTKAKGKSEIEKLGLLFGDKVFRSWQSSSHITIIESHDKILIYWLCMATKISGLSDWHSRGSITNRCRLLCCSLSSRGTAGTKWNIPDQA